MHHPIRTLPSLILAAALAGAVPATHAAAPVMVADAAAIQRLQLPAAAKAPVASLLDRLLREQAKLVAQGELRAIQPIEVEVVGGLRRKADLDMLEPGMSRQASATFEQLTGETALRASGAEPNYVKVMLAIHSVGKDAQGKARTPDVRWHQQRNAQGEWKDLSDAEYAKLQQQQVALGIKTAKLPPDVWDKAIAAGSMDKGVYTLYETLFNAALQAIPPAVQTQALLARMDTACKSIATALAQRNPSDAQRAQAAAAVGDYVQMTVPGAQVSRVRLGEAVHAVVLPQDVQASPLGKLPLAQQEAQGREGFVKGALYEARLNSQIQKLVTTEQRIAQSEKEIAESKQRIAESEQRTALHEKSIALLDKANGLREEIYAKTKASPVSDTSIHPWLKAKLLELAACVEDPVFKGVDSNADAMKTKDILAGVYAQSKQIAESKFGRLDVP